MKVEENYRWHETERKIDDMESRIKFIEKTLEMLNIDKLKESLDTLSAQLKSHIAIDTFERSTKRDWLAIFGGPAIVGGILLLGQFIISKLGG